MHIRLVKGAYVETQGVHPYGEATDIDYLQLAFRLAGQGSTWSMATHDGRLREALLLALGPVPVEHLLGVRPDVLSDLRSRGGADPDLRPLRQGLVPLLDAPRRRVTRRLILVPVPDRLLRRSASEESAP